MFIPAYPLHSLTNSRSSSSRQTKLTICSPSVKGRPHYYSTKKEEYAHIRFSLNADFSSLFNWNTKQIFVYVSASWPSNSSEPATLDNEAVIWDTIITNPSADHLQNIGPAAMKKLVKSSKGKSIDPSRLVHPFYFSPSFTSLDMYTV